MTAILSALVLFIVFLFPLFALTILAIYAHQSFYAGKQLGEESWKTQIFYDKNRQEDKLLVEKEFLFPKLFWKGYKKGLSKKQKGAR